MTPLKIIVRDAGAQMMNMVEPDIAGEPLQDSGQLVKRAAHERCVGVIPFVGTRPIGALELMLNCHRSA